MRPALLLVLLTASACSPGAGDNARRFPLTGTVLGYDTSSSRAVVAHERVDGLMPAMSMTLEVVGVTPSLRQGDRIEATLIVTNTRSWLENVKIIAAGAAAGRTLPTGTGATPGALVPDLELVDQDGHPFRLGRFAGRVVVVTFIYTRCPLPDFCPLMVRHLESVRQRANAAGVGGRLSLLGVTLDPGFDTPAVLRAYGTSVLKGAGRFDQWTLATGTAAQIEGIARYFAVGYRAEGGLVTHTLTTAVISHDGRIMRTFASNSWRPEDLFAVVTVGLQRAAAD